MSSYIHCSMFLFTAGVESHSTQREYLVPKSVLPGSTNIQVCCTLDFICQ